MNSCLRQTRSFLWEEKPEPHHDLRIRIWRGRKVRQGTSVLVALEGEDYVGGTGDFISDP